MWLLSFQDQSTNFEEEILNQMELSQSSNSQSNTSLLNSDFQSQRFLDNFQEQMGSKGEKEEINPFFLFSDINEKSSFLSQSSNECLDTVKKIRHINDEDQQQDIFDIKDFYFINESLFEESLQSKKQKNRSTSQNNIPMPCYLISNPVNNSLALASFMQENNQIEKLQKMTESINLSLQNLLRSTIQSSQDQQKNI